MLVDESTIGLVVGLVSGGIGSYIGLRLGVAKTEWDIKHLKDQVQVLKDDSARYNEDLLMHDVEMDDVCIKLAIPRKKRQNWRFHQ